MKRYLHSLIANQIGNAKANCIPDLDRMSMENLDRAVQAALEDESKKGRQQAALIGGYV